MFNLPVCLDLHDLSIDRGFNKTLCFIKMHKMKNTRNVKIVTGRSGKMNREFEHWMRNPSFKPLVKSFKSWDDRGSWLVTLKY